MIAISEGRLILFLLLIILLGDSIFASQKGCLGCHCNYVTVTVTVTVLVIAMMVLTFNDSIGIE